MTNLVRYSGQSIRGLSPALWQNWPAKLLASPGLGIFIFDDFENVPAMTTGANTGRYAFYQDTGVTLKGIPTVNFGTKNDSGVLEVAGNDADNDEGSITTGGNSGAFAMISDTAGDKRKVIFECRIKKASIADNAAAFFVGLAEENLAAADTLIDDTGEVASKDLIGFQVLHADGELVNSIYRKAAQAKQTVKASVATMVADTYMRLGFIYQPNAVAAEQIAFFVDGIEQPDYVTGTNIAAATFPDAEELAMLWATKVGAAAESKLQLDWWACAQLLVEGA